MGVSETASILKAVGNLNKARIIAHLTKHRGETAEDIAKHLGYPLPTVYKYLRELEVAKIVESESKERLDSTIRATSRLKSHRKS